MFSKNKTNLKISKVKLTIFTSLILKCVLLGLFWSEYSKIAPNPYQIWGADEAYWVKKSRIFENSISENGLIFSMLNSFDIIADRHCAWPLVVGTLFHYFNENILFVLYFKMIVYTISCFLIYKISMFYFTYSASYNILIFTIIYPPLTIYHFSMMREELIFFFIVVFFFFLLKILREITNIKNNIFILLSLFILFYLRINVMICLTILYITSLLFFSKGKFKFLFLVLIGVLLLFNLSFISNLFGILRIIFTSINITEIIFSFLRFMISPLPWKIGADNHHIYNAWWYWVTISLMALSFYYYRILLMSCLKTNLILAFIFLYFLTYLANVFYLGDSRMAIGPRQFALIGPLFFLVFYGSLLSKIKNYRP